MKRANRGFTLLELVIALALLAAMMALLYSGVAFALRAWDVGEATGHRASSNRLAENFLRRELSELFPMRWKDAIETKIAFEGDAKQLRFVSSRPAGLSEGGLSLVGLAAEATGATKNLVMRRAPPDDDAKSFAPLDKAEPVDLFTGIEAVEFAYFGSESDLIEPKWTDAWTIQARVPQLVRLRVKLADGSAFPEIVVAVRLGEESACFENTFQRVCRPRRPT